MHNSEFPCLNKAMHTDINLPWIDRYIPKAGRPYALLMRLDRPVGVWLLLWPCWWSLLLAAEAVSLTLIWYGALFTAGAIIMRGAGCVVNDLADRDFDGKVERTRNRPLPSGLVTPKQAAAFAAALALIGLVILMQFNTATVIWGVASLGPVIIYPFMKRITHWPQVVLGIAFNWGALLGWVAITGSLSWPAVALYLGGLCWTVGYDTIYAHQDREDDAIVGVKSTALRFGAASGRWITGFYVAAITLWVLAGVGAGQSWPYFVGVAAMAGHFVWQVRTLDIDDPARCLHLFKSNIQAGGLICLGAFGALLVG